MIDKEILKENAAIARAFLNKSIIEQEFSWRFHEKICRAEIQETKKKFNRISLVVSIILVLTISILIVLQNQSVIFQNDAIIPILLIPLIVVLIAVAVVEFFLIRKIGYNELLKKLGTTDKLTKELNGYKKSNTGRYLAIQQHFETVKTIETNSLLPGYFLKILFDLKRIDEEKITYNIFYKYMFYICLGKSKLIYQALSELENKEEIIALIDEYSVDLKNLANEYSVGNIAPQYFINKTVKILDNIDLFDPNSIEIINPDNTANFAALDAFLQKIVNENLNWILVGSTNLAIQNVNIQAKDIDIVTTKDDAFKIMDIFKSSFIKEVEYSESSKYKSYFGKMKIKGIQFDIMAELEYKLENGDWVKSLSLDKIEYINYKEYKLPVLPLKYEVEFYKKMKRERDMLRIQLIEEHWKSQNTK